MPTIVHFDVPADDIARARKFYTELFGWNIEKLPGPLEYYHISTTDESGNAGLGGGMGPRGEEGQRITVYIGVHSVDAYLAKVTALGGTVVMPKTAVPGFGYLALCLDTEQNVFGLWEDDSSAGT